jgi:hypothetical protein
MQLYSLSLRPLSACSTACQTGCVQQDRSPPLLRQPPSPRRLHQHPHLLPPQLHLRQHLQLRSQPSQLSLPGAVTAAGVHSARVVVDYCLFMAGRQLFVQNSC